MILDQIIVAIVWPMLDIVALQMAYCVALMSAGFFAALRVVKSISN